MKKLIWLSAIISILIVILPLVGTVSASGYERYTTEAVSAQEKETFLDTKNFRRCEAESLGHAISCFAISEDGLIALGFNVGEDAQINIYNSKGRFLYGYQFANKGGTLVIFFEDEALSLFWGKRDYIASFDSEGNCIQLRKAINTNQTADAYHSDRWRPASGTIGKIQYQADGNGMTSQYTRFIIEDDDGNRTVIYDATEEVRSKNIVFPLLLTSVAALVLFLIYKDKTKNNDH